MENTTELSYQRAKERVDCIKGFYSNLTAYIIIIPVLAYVNYRTSDFLWVFFPAIGWGLGLIAHGMSAYNYIPFLGRDWEQRKIREFMENDKL